MKQGRFALVTAKKTLAEMDNGPANSTQHYVVNEIAHINLHPERCFKTYGTT